jgi:hypothetical protein
LIKLNLLEEIMPTPNENIHAVTVLRAKVEAHFSQSSASYTVLYPQGDFPVHGVRASKGAGCAVALSRLLARMESFPSPVRVAP